MIQQSKRIAAINDLTGYGRCSLTIAIPILSVMGHQCCPVPTSVFSRHTGFPDYSFHDMTDSMAAYLANWNENELQFDSVYTGFLGSSQQIAIIERYLKNQPGHPLLLVDPVMGDHGSLYGTYSRALSTAMRRLVKQADIITPNLTEAAFLLDEEYQGEEVSMEYAFSLAKRLSLLGPETVVITGIKSKGGMSSACLNHTTGKETWVTERLEGGELPASGTGDLFASILLGGLLRGNPLEAAVKTAMAFIADAIALSYNSGAGISGGIPFEPILYKLFSSTN